MLLEEYMVAYNINRRLESQAQKLGNYQEHLGNRKESQNHASGTI